MNTDVARRSDVGPSASPFSRTAVTCFAVLFAIGTAAGLIQLINDTYTTSTGAGVAVANLVHCVIAVITIGLVVAMHRRHPARLRAFVRAPFTAAGWRCLLLATVALPLWLVDIVLATSCRRSGRHTSRRLLV